MRLEHSENILVSRLLLRDRSIAGVRVKALSYAVMAGLSLGFGGTALAQENGQRAQSLEEVIVTARRKEETVQTTPLAITAITPDQLAASGVKEIRDLNASVPGVNMTASGAANNTVFSIRGRSKGAIGIVQPSVTTYVNEVPVANWGASLPTYDLASVQVLKGPQGTLFGRNSTTGAVLLSTKEPEMSLGGYVSATLGEYNWQTYEGAVNLPIIDDKLAIRVAGQIARRDGYTENMSFEGHDMDDLHKDNYRVSVLFTPIEDLSNVTIYDYSKIDEVPGAVLYGYDSNPALPVNAFAFLVGSSADAYARQVAGGERKAWTDLKTFVKGELEALINTTTYDTGSITIKNIIGYRTVEFNNLSDVDSTDLAILNATTEVAYKQLTEEFQVSGSVLDDSIDYVAGLFYLKSEPNGVNRLTLQQFAMPGTPIDNPPVPPTNGATGNGDFYTEESKAVYGQVTFKLGELANSLDKFSVDIGARYTEDSQSVCDASVQFFMNPGVTEGECNAQAVSIDQATPASRFTKQEADFSKVTWTFGLNYQATDELFLYGVTRKGYRGGGINTPVFSGALVPYQQFEPEEVQDYELGSKLDFSFGDVLGRWNLALFSSEFDKLQTGISGQNLDGDGNPINDPSNLTFYANVGKATVEGVETDLTVEPVENLQVNFGGAYLDKKIDEFDIPAGFPLSEEAITNFAFLASPRYSYNAGVAYTLPMSGLGEMVFSYRYYKISEVRYGSVLASPYEKSDVRVSWNNIADTGVDVSAFVNNAFDVVGVVAPAGSTEIGINSVIYNEPRMWGVTAQYKFGAN